MSSLGFAKSKEYWYRFAWGTLIGLLSAIVAYIFILFMSLGIGIVWHDTIEIAPFSGSWSFIAIMTLAGFLVGLIYKWLSIEPIEIYSAIPKGTMELSSVPGIILVSLISLIGGFSLGPEAPTAILAGGLGVSISNKNKLPEDVKQTNFLSGVAGGFSGLLMAPFAIIIMIVELQHCQSRSYYNNLIIAAAAALLGFAVFNVLGNQDFFDSLGFIKLPSYELRLWHIFFGILLGVVGAIFALLFSWLLKTFNKLALPLAEKPLWRCTLAGFLLGLLAKVMPLTLFLGGVGLKAVVEQRTELGLGFLSVAVLAKLIAVTGALAAGFIGGSIFPLFFVGGTLGIILWRLLPSIPMTLAVVGLMAAVSAALAPFPLMVGVLALLITDTKVDQAIPVIVACLTSYFIFNGILFGFSETSE